MRAHCGAKRAKCAQSAVAPACMKLAQIQIYACDRLVISAGPGRENSSHRHFGAIVTIAADAPVTLMSRDAAPVVCQAAIVAPNAWHRIDARNTRTVTVLIGADHPWFGYLKPLLSGEPIVRLDFAMLADRSIPWEALFEGTCDCLERSAPRRRFCRRSAASTAASRLDSRIEEVLQILREARTTRRRRTSSADASDFRLHAHAPLQGRARRAHSRIRAWRRLMLALELVDRRTTIARSHSAPVSTTRLTSRALRGAWSSSRRRS